MRLLIIRWCQRGGEEMVTIKIAASSLSVFVRGPKQRCVTSFYFPPSSRWWVPSVTLLMTASKLCCLGDWSAHSPPLKHPCRGFLHREARGEGVKVKVWHRATDLQQRRPLSPGCSRSATWWSQVASDLTSTPGEPVGREAEIKKWKRRANLVWRKDQDGGRGDCVRRGGSMKQSVQK